MNPTAAQPLSFEVTRGTKTFYFPFNRESGESPRVTIMVKRVSGGAFHAGVAVCSQEDNFVRRVGRRIAFHRMLGKPVVAPNSDELVAGLRDYFDGLELNRSDLISEVIWNDLDNLYGLEAAFDILDENRRKKATTLEAGAEGIGC